MKLSLLALALLPVAACSADGIDRGAFDIDVCASSAGWDPLASVTPQGDAFVELVDAESGASVVAGRRVVSKHGASCVSAPDAVACAAAIDEATSQTGWVKDTCGGAGCTHSLRFFVTENAGVVSVVADPASLRDLLAPIDTAADAALLAAYTFEPDGIDCTKPQVLARPNGSYDVFLATGDGDCTDRVEQRVSVTEDGTTALLQKTTSAASQVCLSP